MAGKEKMNVVVPMTDLQAKALEPIWVLLTESQKKGDPGFVLAQITDEGFCCKFFSCKFISAGKSRQLAEILGQEEIKSKLFEKKWTKERPSKEGWYWKRVQGVVDIVYVRRYCNQLCIMNWPISDNAEWVGPLEEPEE